MKDKIESQQVGNNNDDNYQPLETLKEAEIKQLGGKQGGQLRAKRPQEGRK